MQNQSKHPLSNHQNLSEQCIQPIFDRANPQALESQLRGTHIQCSTGITTTIYTGTTHMTRQPRMAVFPFISKSSTAPGSTLERESLPPTPLCACTHPLHFDTATAPQPTTSWTIKGEFLPNHIHST